VRQRRRGVPEAATEVRAALLDDDELAAVV
jgi:hypothetical protein